MDNLHIDEDEIDTEALQAQIDLSMSFAQNLVSSWIKPSRKLSSRSRDVEGELKEHMRRPQRLGVGAPIPATQSFSREAARLKGQLTGRGMKRTKEDEAEVKKDKSESSDEEESKTRAIKKKTRLDPFGDINGKRRKKRRTAPDSAGGTSAALAVPRPIDVEMSEQAEVVGMVTEADSMTDAQLAAVPPPQSSSSAKKPDNQLQVSPARSPAIQSDSIDKTDRNTPEKPPAKDSVQRSPNTRQGVDISLTSTPVLPSNRRSLPFQSIEKLKQSVLNLNTLSSDENSDQEAGTEAHSPKKKRKRRKKKRKNLS